MTPDPLAQLQAALAGAYRIDRELGRGGMATVYLAHDLRHDREVAIKVLRPELTAILGGERFLQEIRVTARLAHPHILPLLDSGEAHDLLYYVAPYVEGQSLRQRLVADGPLSLAEAVRITRGVAAALDSAHRRGIVHRDIKPENILLQDGEPLVADFGIALAVSSLGRERLTETGLSLGTPAYMSPEQASADPRLDGRSDEYSLASVVYEMLAGEPPYSGPTAQAIIAKRMTEPLPRLGAVREVPAGVEQALSRALSRNPADRFGSVVEFASALEQTSVASGTTGQTIVVQPPRAGPSRRVVALLSAVAVLGVLGAMGLYFRGRAPTAAASQRQLTFGGDVTTAAISADGKWIAYGSGDSVLFVRERSGGRAIPVIVGSYVIGPRWSPDGAALLVHATLDTNFAVSDALYEIPRLGGEPRLIAAGGVATGDYSPDGKSIATFLFDTVLIVDRASAAVRRRFTMTSLTGITELRWSPDGRWLAAAGTSKQGFSLALVSPEGRDAGLILETSSASIAWDSRGTALYVALGSDLLKLSVDGRTGRPVGSPVPVLSGLPPMGDLTVSADGRALAMNRGTTSWQVWAITGAEGGKPRRADIRQLSAGTRRSEEPVVSPDGEWVMWVEREGTATSLLRAPTAGGPARTLTRYQAARMRYPTWAPDGSGIGFVLSDSAGSHVMLAGPDGEKAAAIAPVTVGFGRPWTWSPNRIAVWSQPDSGFLLLDPVTGKRSRIRAADSTAIMFNPVVSPDGKTLLAARARPYGLWNDLWSVPIGGGEWAPVPYAVNGDPGPFRWDSTGIYVDVIQAIRARTLPARVYRARRLGEAFTPFLAGLDRCNTGVLGGSVTLSRDHTRGACSESKWTPDLWLVSDFDPDAR